MILRLLTCFSLLVAGGGGVCVRGKIAIADAGPGHKMPADLSGVVIWLEPLFDLAPPPRHAAEKLRMVQKNKAFVPHVLAVPVGASVDFPNFDPIFHNAFSNYNGQIFDVGLYPPGSSRSVVFRRSGIVRIFCNIHSSMSAVIVVLSSPFYAVSKRDGSFAIDEVPEGSYRMNVYYERATEETLTACSRTIDVKGAVQQAGEIRISESGYLPLHHLNKYGKPYGASPDSTTYPGARQ